MKLFDTHAHFPPDEAKILRILKNARRAGLGAILAVGGSSELNSSALAARCLAPDLVHAAIGFDRDQAGKNVPPADYSQEGIAAVGEIGLDFHYAPESAALQCELFARQLELAKTLGLPVVIHTREADDATLGVLDETDSHRGIIHSFTGTRQAAAKFLDRGFFISFSGIVTFRLADNVRETALYVPLDRILIETDAPFLAPVPLRGKENEPANVAHTCRFLAALRGVEEDAFAERTFNNAILALALK